LSEISRSIDVNAHINRHQKSANRDRFYDSNRRIEDIRFEREIEHTTRLKHITRMIGQPVSPRCDLQPRATLSLQISTFIYVDKLRLISHMILEKKTQMPVSLPE